MSAIVFTPTVIDKTLEIWQPAIHEELAKPNK
jgi:hypothetical protein